MAINFSGISFMNLVSVKPLGPPPIGILQYVDFKYDDKLEQRRKKL